MPSANLFREDIYALVLALDHSQCCGIDGKNRLVWFLLSPATPTQLLEDCYTGPAVVHHRTQYECPLTSSSNELTVF